VPGWPIVIALLIVNALFYGDLLGDLFPVPGQYAQRMALTSNALTTNTILLVIVGAIVFTFRDGLVTRKQVDTICEEIKRFGNVIISKSLDPDEEFIAEDFCSTTEEEIERIWDAMYHVDRLFKWTNYTLFALVLASSSAFFLSDIRRSPELWRLGFCLLETVLIMIIVQMAVCVFPHIVKRWISSASERGRPEKKYRQFKDAFQRAVSEPEEFADRIDHALKKTVS
jgi:cytochrome bd-type quinol oxidase subunit 2